MPGRSHRPVEPGRGGDGARRRRAPRRGRARRTSGCAPCSAPTAPGTRTTSATRSRTPRSTRTSPATSRTARGTTTSPPATPRSSREFWPMVEARDRLRARLPARDRRDRVARRRPRRRRAAHRLVEHPPEPACAIAIAERLGHERPDWELSLGALAIAIAHRPDVFLDKDRWAMDWYYPILGGVLRGYAGARARRGRLDDVRGRGPRACAACRTARGSPRPRRASS